MNSTLIKAFSTLLFLLSWLFLSGGITHNHIKCIDEEREALLKFKQGIRVDNCGLLSSWGDQEHNHLDCCEWHGVQCSNHTRHVIKLDLHGENGNCLQGQVSPSISKLKHLKYLDLSLNYFQGQTIPSFIGSLFNLDHLNLSYARFEGEIPHQLGNLSRLSSLDLSCDNDRQYARSLWWVSHLPLLREINLSGIDLSKATDWFQVINNLPFLTALHMDDCHLPPRIPSLLPNPNSSNTLHLLSLAQNNLSDTSVFQWVFNLSGVSTNLAYLNLSGNSLRGPLSSYFGNIHSLTQLDLSSNQLQGQIPTNFGNLQALSYLDLSGNQLECPIPNTLSNLTSLGYLNLSMNSLQGSQCLPKTLGNLCSLKTLSLSNNNLTDEFSSIIQILSGCAHQEIEHLRLGRNSIHGSVPDMISIFSSLRTLYLSHNKLNGTISQSIGKLSTLEDVTLSHNSLHGTLSERHFSELSRLRDLYLGNNTALAFNVSADWVPPFQMESLSLRSCNLGPRFPKWLQSQTNLSLLDISEAGISDTVPSSFWSLPRPSLSFLSMYYNNISGELPDCWTNMGQLEVLDLSTNKFSGKIPGSLGALPNLVLLQLDNNNFSGELPLSLGNCTSLVELDLGANSLTGRINPSIWGSLQNLTVLSLRYNNFHGSIPLTLCQMSALQLLDFSFNNISGTIPTCIYNLTSITQKKSYKPNTHNYYIADQLYYEALYVIWKRTQLMYQSYLKLVKMIDLSSNQLEGEIPENISILTGLVALNLSRNNLTGIITEKFGQLTNLQSLDLSNNHLSGKIPESFSKLNFLEVLDLSNNNLTGKIPSGTQLQGFDESPYIGNTGLCGPPLLKKCPGEKPDDSHPATGNNVSAQDDSDGDDHLLLGLYISIVLGFITGFWAVCGTLILKTSWRHAFSQWIDDTTDRIYKAIVVNLPKMWKKPVH